MSRRLTLDSFSEVDLMNSCALTTQSMKNFRKSGVSRLSNSLKMALTYSSSTCLERDP